MWVLFICNTKFVVWYLPEKLSRQDFMHFGSIAKIIFASQQVNELLPGVKAVRNSWREKSVSSKDVFLCIYLFAWSNNPFVSLAMKVFLLNIGNSMRWAPDLLCPGLKMIHIHFKTTFTFVFPWCFDIFTQSIMPGCPLLFVLKMILTDQGSNFHYWDVFKEFPALLTTLMLSFYKVKQIDVK